MQQNKSPYQTIFFEVHERLATITLNRPEKKNAINSLMLDELFSCISEIKNGNFNVLLLKANGDMFCAGADLKERAGMTEPKVFAFLDKFKNTLLLIESVPFPTVCSIHGDAFGGGVEIALAFDIRYMSKSAKVSLSETKLGIIPGAGGTQRLARLIGSSLAKEWIFTGSRVDGHTATTVGFANGFMETSHFPEFLQIKIESILSSAPLSLRLSKTAIEQGIKGSLLEGLEIERAEYIKTLKTKDRLEGLKAFAEKRPPKFVGE
jgi:methylglutaconyl-CoA hydratase